MLSRWRIPMRLGYFAMPLHPPGADPARTMDDDLVQLATLDRLGYEEAWVGGHCTAQWEIIPCPALFIARALGMTKRMTLATGVSCLPNHDPLMLAQRIAQLDQMARGRFYWGVGSGGFPGDFEMFGVDPKSGEHRVITREILDTVLALWQDAKPGAYEGEGRRWRFTVPQPQPDIGLRLHLRPYQKPHWEAVETGAKRAGRIADRKTWRIARDVFVADTDAKARREAIGGTLGRDYRDYFLKLLPKLRGFDMLKVDPAMADPEVTLEYLCDNIWIVGSPDTVATKLARLAEDVGGFGTLLVIAHEWTPRGAWERSMRLLKEEVVPRLSRARSSRSRAAGPGSSRSPRRPRRGRARRCSARRGRA